MDNFDRVRKIKGMNSISDLDDVQFSDLFLCDENGETVLEYIVKNNIKIEETDLYQNRFIEKVIFAEE